MRFLGLLRLQGYPDRKAANTQIQLGKMLAMDDYRGNPKDSALHLIEQYTSNETWYAAFRSAYLSEWTRLVKTGPADR
jgi:energy-converting hydrogenase Eha subunit F